MSPRYASKVEFADFADSINETTLEDLTLPLLLDVAADSSRRYRTAEHLHKKFVKAWLHYADAGYMQTDEAIDFVYDFGVVPDKETAATLLARTAITPRGLDGVTGPMTRLRNDSWGDGEGSVCRFQVPKFLPRISGYREYGILNVKPPETVGYKMARAPVSLLY